MALDMQFSKEPGTSEMNVVDEKSPFTTVKDKNESVFGGFEVVHDGRVTASRVPAQEAFDWISGVCVPVRSLRCKIFKSLIIC